MKQLYLAVGLFEIRLVDSGDRNLKKEGAALVLHKLKRLSSSRYLDHVVQQG